jgi:type 2 lantibiotic biosynthesis protein LanM
MPALSEHSSSAPTESAPPRRQETVKAETTTGLLRWAAEAQRIGDQLLGNALRAKDGAPVWLKHGNPFDSDGKPIPLGPHLYNGACGVSLFLAAFASENGDKKVRAAALASLVPLRQRLAALVANPARAESTSLRIGGMIGLGAFLYVFTRIGQWLEEPVLLREACDIAGLLTAERITSDNSLDVMYGSAGALLGLLALEKAVPRELSGPARLLERATACASHLLEQRISTSGGAKAWPYQGGLPLPAFAHGASGIATALSRLAERTGDDSLRAAALEGLRFERERFAPEQQNWRSTEARDENLMIAWCNGAPGVALGRLEAMATGQIPAELQAELEIALATTKNAPPAISDFLCCGNMGRADVLLEGARVLGRDDLLQAAHEIAAGVVASAAGDWFGPVEKGRNPSFFRGVSGIGYSLLRHSGSRLPNVLTLE